MMFFFCNWIKFRRITWKRRTDLGKVSWGTLSWGETAVDPAIMMHSRQCGFHLITPIVLDCVQPEGNFNELLSTETHIGFCKPYLCSDRDVVVPIGDDKIGIYIPDDTRVRVCYTFQTTIMSIKEVAYREATKYLMCTTKDGYVHLLAAKLDPDSRTFQVNSLSQLLLPNYQNNEQQPVGVCVEGYDNIFVVGSNLKFMFLIKWIPDGANSLQPFGKKILPTEGVSCMAMREKKGILAAGCFDGTVRIFGFPQMNQISTINYHKTQINALLFINEKSSRDGQWYLLCGASDSGLSVWNIPSSKVYVETFP